MLAPFRVAVSLSRRPFPSRALISPSLKRLIDRWFSNWVPRECDREQAPGPYPLLLWVSHPDDPCDFEVAGSTFLFPALAFMDALAEYPEAPFMAQASQVFGFSGQRTVPRACFSVLAALPLPGHG